MKTFKKAIMILLSLTALLSAQEKPDRMPVVDIYMFAKITVLVHDENNQPVDGAKLHIRFSHANGAYNDGYNDFYVQSNRDGKFEAESECMGSIVVEVSKDGYYASELSYQPADWSKKYENGAKLQPWNPTVPIILKKIGKPVPMYVRTGNREARYFPHQDIEYGFDLIADDWVAPDGKGTVSDIMLKSELFVKDKNNHDVKLTIRFPNKGDGWIPISKLEGVESQLKYPREAPVAGYLEEPIVFDAEIHKLSSGDLLKGGHPYGYFIRTRTKLDQNGAVVSALHSKIIDSNLNPPIDQRRLKNPILFGGSPGDPNDTRIRKGCFFAIDYYLNPKPNDRTLEFDRKTNLAPEVDREAAAFAP